MSKTYINSDAIIDGSIAEEKLSEITKQKLDKVDSLQGLTTDEVNQILV